MPHSSPTSAPSPSPVWRFAQATDFARWRHRLQGRAFEACVD